ncbi:MAG: hypothetical protein NT049_08200 [Planctomycetota bacterium]|nr:hypothetical protein [Planctomycetota bacterium]
MMHARWMRSCLAAIVALALGAAVAAAAAPLGKPDADGSYSLTLDQLPAPVKAAFLEQAGGNPIRGISMEMKDGKPVYDCDVFVGGKKCEVIADASGKLLSTPLAGAKAGAPPAADAQADASAPKFQDAFKVDKAKLSDTGAGTYFILVPGYKLTLQDGKDTLVITVLDETKTVDGVKCRIVEERETKDGKLEEVSRNYFAIDKATGDAYYFGEDVDMYGKDGKITNHEGSWLSGVDGARFGMLVPGKPMVGARYQQEVAPKAAMDRAEVVSITETVKVPAGTFTGCLKTKESSGLESGVEEKLYAPEVGLLKDGGFELAKIEKPKVELPPAAAKAFKDAFPKGEIEKLEAEEENGVMVYDIEFKNGAVEQEMDITADGTILEITLVVDAKAVPAAAMKAIEKAAEGGKITRIENIDIRYETKDGKAIKLAKPVTHFAAEFTKGDKSAEVVVTPDGTPVKE